MATDPQLESTPEKKHHPHPRRHHRARVAAQAIGMIGILAIVVGLWYITVQGSAGAGWPVALVPLGATTILLAAIWYFTYMEHLEPELYQHEEGFEHDEDEAQA
jgi:hypothetical protein